MKFPVLFAGLNEIDAGTLSAVSPYITLVSRYALPALAVVILVRCAISMLSGRPQSEVWGYITTPGGGRTMLTNWENVVGRAPSSDVILDYKTVSRTHAALIRNAEGRWSVVDLGSKGGTLVRGHRIAGPVGIRSGDIISFGGVDAVFVASTISEEQEQAERREMPGFRVRSGMTLTLLTLFCLLLALQLCAAAGEELSIAVPATFIALVVIIWSCYIITRVLNRRGFEVETLAFLLTAVGFGVCAHSDPDVLPKELFCLIAGLALYFTVGSFLRDLGRASKLRWPIAAMGLLLLAVNLVTASSLFGAKNWLSIGSISFQPSEFVKISFVFAGAATLERLFARRNLILFVAFAAVCVLCLAAMSDFGTAAVFFASYIVIAFMRSGSFATVFLSLAGTVFAAFIVLTARPYVMQRFATWGSAWDVPNDAGYQQVRAMAGAASGGLFGLGAGRGWLHGIFAADTDMVFAVVTEELGLIMGLVIVAAIIVLAVFAVRSSGYARSTFYAIAACASVTILLFQLILNVFGSLDILPFTGVTFPLVSKGGSSLIATWGLLAFIKAADARQNASFAIALGRRRTPRRERREAEEE